MGNEVGKKKDDYIIRKLTSFFLSALIGSSSTFSVLPDSSNSIFCLFQNFTVPSVEVSILSIGLIPSFGQGCSFLMHTAWILIRSQSPLGFLPSESHWHSGQKSHLLIGSIYSCYLQKEKSWSSQYSKIPEHLAHLQLLHNPS